MGISGLLPALKNVTRPVSLEEYRGDTVGVDAYVWLHRAVHGSAYDLGLGVTNFRYLTFCEKWLDMFAHYGVKPYLVFDGRKLPSKQVTEVERHAKRHSMRELALKLHYAGERVEAEECFQRAVDVTPEIACALMQVLKKRKIPYIVAPNEADAQLAFLSRNGHISAVVTEDSDLLVFECPRVIYKLDIYGDGLEIRYDELSKIPDMRRLIETDPSKFRHACIMSGCDYLPSVPKVGLKTAIKFITISSDYLAAIKQLCQNPQYKVPENYSREFVRAEMTFRFQWVYDPTSKKIVHLTTPPEMLAKYDMFFLGEPITDRKKIKGLVTGALHPDTLEPISIPDIILDTDLSSEASSPFGEEACFEAIPQIMTSALPDVQRNTPPRANYERPASEPLPHASKVVTPSQSRHFFPSLDNPNLQPNHSITSSKQYSSNAAETGERSCHLNDSHNSPLKRNFLDLSCQDEVIRSSPKKAKLGEDYSFTDSDSDDELLSNIIVT